MATAAVGSYDQTVYADAPGAWWKLADAVGSTTAQDFSGWLRVGTAGSVTFGQTSPITVMPLDTAALFNGSADIVSGFNPPTGGTASVEAIVNIATAVTGIILANSSTARTGGVILGLTSGKPYITFGNGTSQATATAASAISTSTNHHVAGTWDGTTIRLYVDGAQAATASLAGTFHTGQTNLAIGVNPDGNTGFLVGTLSQVAFFASVNSAADIANRFALMTGGFAAPVLMVQCAFGADPFSGSTPQAFPWNPLFDTRSFSQTTGRQHELQRFEAGTASILLDNTDARYSPWNTSGPVYGDISIATPTQVQASYGGMIWPVFYGYTQSWTPQWVGTGYSNMSLALYDGLQFLSLFELGNGTLYPGVIEGDGAVAFWRFSDTYTVPPAAGNAVDLINGNTALVTGLTAGTQSFGEQGPIMYDPATALTLASSTAQVALPMGFLNYMIGNSGSGWSVDFWVNNISGSSDVFQISGSSFIEINNGVVQFETLIGTSPVHDGLPHHIAVVSTANISGNVTLYVDGVSQGTLTGSANPGFEAGFPLIIAGGPVTIANLAYYTSMLTPTQVSNHFNTGYYLQQVQSTGARIQVILEQLCGVPAAYCNIATGLTTNCQGETSSVVGTKALDYIDNIVQTEQSQFFQSPSGVFTFQDRHYAVDNGLTIISQALFSNDPANPGCQYEQNNPDMPLDDLDFFDVFTVTRNNGIEQIWSNQGAIASGLLRQQDITGLYYSNDTDSLYCAQWLALKYGSPLQRVQGLEAELYDQDGSNTGASGSYIAAILAQLFMNRVTVRRVGKASGDVFQQDSLIEGIDMTVGTGSSPEWKVTLAPPALRHQHAGHGHQRRARDADVDPRARRDRGELHDHEYLEHRVGGIGIVRTEHPRDDA